jgi:hypothetical protein
VQWDASAGAGARETLARRGTHRPSLAGVALLIAALAIGVASHLVWDAFSHDGRAGLALLPALNAQWGPLAGYKWVQHGSSALGLIVLAGWAVLWWRRAPVSPVGGVLPRWMPWAWLAALPALLIAACVIGLAVFGPLTAQFTPQHLAYRVLPPACAAWGACTAVLCVAVQLVRRRS